MPDAHPNDSGAITVALEFSHAIFSAIRFPIIFASSDACSDHGCAKSDSHICPHGDTSANNNPNAPANRGWGK